VDRSGLFGRYGINAGWKDGQDAWKEQNDCVSGIIEQVFEARSRQQALAGYKPIAK